MNYTSKLTDNLVNVNKLNTKRNSTIHKLNYFGKAEIYTGKWLVELNLSKYSFGFKLGQFTKTRKPYYFRSKKKIVKKKKLSQHITNITKNNTQYTS
jgi:ribosomal protein S19